MEKPGIVIHACNPSTEAEAGGLKVEDQLEIQ
jgi:hypothetical protein